MPKATKFLIVFLLSLFSATSPDAASRRPHGTIRYIEFRNGSGVRGVILRTDRNRIRVRTAYAILDIHRSSVRSISTPDG